VGQSPPDSNGRLNAVDVLSLTALLLLAVVVAFFRRQLREEVFWLLGLYAALSAFVLIAAFRAPRQRAWRLVHDFSPILLVIAVFSSLGPIIDCASPARWDVTFARLDGQLLGDLPQRWRDLLGRPAWLVDAASIAYVAYYVAPVSLAVLLYLRRPPADFRRMAFTVVLTFYASYAGYFVFPTLGPRVSAEAGAPLIGGDISQAVRVFIDLAERTRTDAFPSGHTAIALLCVYFARQFSAVAFAIFSLAATGIVFSTVYLHYHYVVDLIAGALLAGGCAWMAPRLQPLLEPHEMRRWLAVRLGHR